MKIKKILIANRGEIAIRVMRSAKEMGIKTVAVYSEADKAAAHVLYADEAVLIGPPPSAQSYLVADKIIEACKLTGADAVHPGYGFLSENAQFAEKIAQAGIIFIGPSVEAIKVMGDKLASKQAVKSFDVPLVPGMDEPISDVEKAKAVAQKIGYPVMIKASAGGGGKGMRIVTDPKDFDEQMTRAVSEARSSFGDEAVFIEKFITSPKHIEVQILGDQYGNIVYLFERECSIQRRNQKVIEEAPSAVLSPEQRKRYGEAAVNVARSCNYYGAGTVEFIADAHLDFYFLEMNTRLQVEHPVTEQISGVDLVKEQIKIAQGEAISFTQEDLQINGHSIEVRVYAEDPENNFLPDTGTLSTYRRPQGAGVRVDDGYEEGMEIPIHYDPMIAKLITHGKDRAEAIERMKRAIFEYKIIGIKTTLPFCEFVLNHPDFIDGSFTTKFVEEHFTPDHVRKEPSEDLERVAAIFAFEQYKAKKERLQYTPAASQKSGWKSRIKRD
ncbi:acetyl-CoA carboxylase biotin carboxylase subunit [Marinoscillum sp. 108]|uniref:acetyl-CoA carboxylase biotin carboxylase subunit n=1 Tax=Marinoscillum sp. 108 TaxID=2653151 RepID=UPI0012F0B183|nr:acetyl-CoA carboxylase biotin carboxylase subunit [Marinoscillum sp. 108]VXD12136.1 Pyruvate carboxylase subunit A [Marinoscillum sp. 108]